MPTPQGIDTVTLHGRFVEPDLFGTPLVGSVTFTPNVPMVTFPVEDTMMSGTETATLDANGEFIIDLPCTDTAGQNPDGWAYTVTEKLIGVRGRTYAIFLDFTMAVVELADITPTDAAPTYLPVTGPQGPPGSVASVNGDTGPFVVLDAADVGAIPTSAINANSGVVGISATGKVGVGVAAGTPQLSLGSAADMVVLDIAATHATRTAAITSLTAQTAADIGFAAQVTGDSQARFTVKPGGGLDWGPGNAGTDVGLTRASSGTLQVAGQITSNQAAPTVAAHLTRKDYVDGLDGANVKLTGTQTVAGAKTWSNAATFNGAITATAGITHSTATAGLTLISVTNSNATPTAPVIDVFAASAAVLIRGRVTADANSRFNLTGAGTLQFGAGSGATDVNFYRSATGVLNSSGQLASDSASPSAASHLTRKDYVDGQITTVNSTITTLDGAVVKLAGTQTVTGAKTFSADLTTSALNRNSRANATDSAYETRVGAEANARWFVQADGKTWWGAGGGTAVDVNLFRNAANVLRTNDAMIVDGDLTVSGNLVNGLQPKMQRGQESFVFSSVASVDVNVTFSPAFAATPRVITSLSMTGTLPSGSSALAVKAFNVSTTGMTLRVNDVGAINRTLTIPADWVAMDQ